ncbi:MAG: hypothetical protein WAU04_06620, partial [Candidatus Nitrotoga sp.]
MEARSPDAYHLHACNRAKRKYCVSKQKPLYSSYALLSPHLAITLYIQPLGSAAAARRALNIPPPSFEAND